MQTHSHTDELLSVVRQILGTVVEAIPDPTDPAGVYVAPERRPPGTFLPPHPMRRATDAPVLPARPKAPSGKKGTKTVLADYRPRVAYHPTHKSPSVRKPLPDTDATVYAAILASPGITAKPLQTRLKLRDGQLWGAIRRLTQRHLIRTVRPSAA